MVRFNSMLLIFCAATPVIAQEFPTPQPDETHKVLAREEGTWDAQVKLYAQGPGQPPIESKGVERVELVAGGLFTRSEFRCTFGDREFTGYGLVGYDPRVKKYVGTWVDSFSSVPTSMEGTFDPQTDTMTTISKLYVPDAQLELTQKQITKFVDDNTRTFEIFLVTGTADQPQDVKLMDMTLKKRP
jgi:hypothetical protein